MAKPFQSVAYAQRNHRCIHNTCAKSLNLLQNGVSLYVRSSYGGPRSKNTASRCRITLAKSCLGNCFQTEKRNGPQSVSLKKCRTPWCVMSNPNLCQFLVTSNFSVSQCIVAGSTDWHNLHAYMADLTAAFFVAGKLCWQSRWCAVLPGVHTHRVRLPVQHLALAIRSPIDSISMIDDSWSQMEMASGSPVTKVILMWLSNSNPLNPANPNNRLILFA